MKSRQRVIASVVACLMVCLNVAAQKEGAWATKKSGWQLLTQTQRKEVLDFAEKYKTYLRVAKTALTSTREILRLARANGFVEFNESAQVKPGARLIFNPRPRSHFGNHRLGICLDRVSPGCNPSRQPAHRLESPSGYRAAERQFALFKTIYYGGIKKYQWANVPLALMGRIDTTDGRTIDVSIGLNAGDPVFVIPDSAPHSDLDLRSRTYTNVFAGEELDPVAGSIPGENSSVVAETLQLADDIQNQGRRFRQRRTCTRARRATF